MEKIDLVYILGNGSRWNNNEIRYSLRSVESYFPAARQVFVIGDCPEWSQNVIHIKVPDTYENKLMNAREKYMAAATDPRIGKNFVLMNDDFFFIRQTEEIPNYSRGTIAEMMSKHLSKNGYYYRSLWDTRRRLDAMGIPEAIDFEVHAPMILNKEKLLTVMGMVGTDKAYSLRSCYGNLMNLEPVTVMDFKAANVAEFALQKMRTDAPFLSINDALVADEYFRSCMLQKFPVISKYETDEKGLGVKPGRPMAARKYYALKEFTYGKNFFHKGDLLPKDVIDTIKDNQSMAGVWKWE